MSDRKIIQIIPATGWYAIYRDQGGDRITQPLACFALVEAIGDGEIVTYVTPMDSDLLGQIEFSTETDNFVGIVHESSPEWSTL